MSRSSTQGVGFVLLLGLLATVGPLSIDTYLPALPTIAHHLGITSSAVQLSVSAFFFGLALGQLIYGPLSDSYGRKPALLVGFGLYLLASLVCALATSADQLIVARALQGLGAAAAPSAGRAIIRDVWSGDKAASMMSYVVMVMAIAPLVAPLLGGQILAFSGWRAIFWLLVAMALLSLLLVVFRLPETNGPEKRQPANLKSMLKSYGVILADGRARAYLICGGMVSAAMFAYITSAPSLYMRLFGVDELLFGFYFGLNVVAMIAANYANGRLVMRYGYNRLLGVGVMVTLASLLVLLAFVLNGSLSLLALVVCLFFAIGMVGLVGGNAMAGMMNLHPRHAGAASSLFGLSQFGLGALTGAIASSLYSGDASGVAWVMVAAAVCAMVAYARLQWFEKAAVITGEG